MPDSALLSNRWSRWPLLLLATMLAAAPGVAREGFFRVESRDGRWLLLDPEGRPFHLRGANHYSDGSAMPWNHAAKYGDPAVWRASMRDRHRAWGFTFLPPSIGPVAHDPAAIAGPATRANLVGRRPEWTAAQFAELQFPFTAFLAVPKEYMSGANLPDVFGPEFAAAVERRCREFVAPLRDNRFLIGYHFSHNPPWNIAAPSAEQWIADCTRPGTPGRAAWIRLMRQVYGSIERWRETYGTPIRSWEEIATMENPLRGYVSQSRLMEDKQTFLQWICEEWHRVYRDAIRRHDPNHLILGDRNTLHLQPAPSPWAFHVMRRYIDVLSVNVMGPARTIYGVLETATRNWSGPILLADTGAGVYSGEPAKAAYQARDLAEFETVYADLMRMSVEHPQIIGFGWCGWFETPLPSNRSGLVDATTDEPLGDRLEIVQKWNAWIEREYAERFRSAGPLPAR